MPQTIRDANRLPLGAAVALVVASIASVQFGASIAKGAFAEVGPTAMTWLRLVGASLSLGLARAAVQARSAVSARRRNQPPVERPARQWRWLFAYAATMIGMNAAIYQSFSRIPVGIAVTLEFLGPLTVGALGSRRARDLAWPLLALVGVALLGLSPARPSMIGVLFALVAAACWGCYIHAAARVGLSWQPVDALLLSCLMGSACFTLPVLLHPPAQLFSPAMLATGLGVGLLSTAIPYSLEILALQKIPARVFGILMSLEPAVAALAALLLLGEHLGGVDIAAMACVVAASIGATRSA